MGKISSSVKESVDKFLNAVSQRYRIEAAYIYGSQAKGIATYWSDIDVAVISSDFTGDLFEERLELMHLAARIDDRIEPCPFNRETFNVNNPLASEIKKNGLRVV